MEEYIINIFYFNLTWSRLRFGYGVSSVSVRDRDMLVSALTAWSRWWPWIIGEVIGEMIGVDGGDAGGVGITAGAAHLLSSTIESGSVSVSGLGAGAAHCGECGAVEYLPWWSSQWALAATALCLFVRGRGLDFFRLFPFCLGLTPPGRKKK